MFWLDKTAWGKAAYNTMWCLAGCSIGDFGTILLFQHYYPSANVMLVMTLAIIAGLLTSIILETVILKFREKWTLRKSLATALGMSLISMIAMEIAMNITDYLMTGGAIINWKTVVPMLLAGFLAPLPYNYWRLKKHSASCCH